MTTNAVCSATLGPPIARFGSRFMMDPAFYEPSREAGYAGLDFYCGGRGGALGAGEASLNAAIESDELIELVDATTVDD